MADTPAPAPQTAPPEAPVGASKSKPVVLATPIGEEFVIPDLTGDDGQPLRITSAGVAMSAADAKRATETAELCRQHLITVTEKG